ncbi:hypothetical protein [uncultured Gammaproteobacteria bacterium]|nr:hypothetical protein [uncultured Gammaproteobacteria bacterium]VVH60417.1 hypothetical protein BAZOLSSOX_229 [uncultured Gammaproteobacteria bacterium]
MLGSRQACNDSPPHRWLRKMILQIVLIFVNSPPHRWLRNKN